MGETAFHRALVQYLIEVLTWLFHRQVCAIHGNLNMYQTKDYYEQPVAPDVAVIKGVAYKHFTRSWRVGTSGPAPQVVFEIASEETWHRDLEDKPAKYASMGVQEYFAYDPHEVPLRASKNRRLFGWRLDPASQSMKEIPPRSDGALWSHHLESWLVPDGAWLRLYNRSGQMRLTHGEFADQQAERERQQAEAEARRSQIYAEKLRSMGIDPEQLI